MIRFWLGMQHRGTSKRNDKLLIGNIDTGEAAFIDVSEILSSLTADDLAESDTRKYITAAERTKLNNLAGDLLTLTTGANHFYPKTENPAGYLTADSALASSKLSGAIAAALIPSLDASKIAAGILQAARIPNLDASKITSGTLDVDRLPMIPATKFEGISNELGNYILKSTIGAANGLPSLDENIKIPAIYIPNFDASKINSGVFSEARIPTTYLKVSQLVDSLESTSTNTPAAANAVRRLKEYVDRLIAGIKLKDDALCATTGNIVLDGEQVIDGVQTEISRVLVWQQDNAAENGLYNTSPNGWTRTDDANTLEDLLSATVNISQGDTLGGSKFICNGAGEIGVDPVSWTEVIEYLLTAAQYAKVVNLPEGEVETTAGAQDKANAAEAAANNYTDTAVANAGKWKGTFLNEADLLANLPEGAGQNWHNNEGGWTADVDAGAGAKVTRYIWDASDLTWELQQGEGTAETAESIRTKYESLADRVGYTPEEKDKVAALRVSGTVPISTNTILSRALHHKMKLFITANVIITYPAAGLGGDFECNAVTNEAGQGAFADEAATPGEDLDAPDGTILEARKMAHLFERPDDGRLSIYGSLIE